MVVDYFADSLEVTVDEGKVLLPVPDRKFQRVPPDLLRHRELARAVGDTIGVPVARQRIRVLEQRQQVQRTRRAGPSISRSLRRAAPGGTLDRETTGSSGT